MNRLLILALIISLNACMHVDPIADKNESSSIWSLTCEEPYTLTLNCFEDKETRLLLEIDGVRVLVSAAEDEATVVLLNRSYEYDFMFVADPTSKTSARVMNFIRTQMEAQGIRVQKVIPITGLGDVHGYIMVFDGKAFSSIRSIAESTSNMSNQRGTVAETR